MKVIIAGSRGFTNYPLLCEKLDFYLSPAVSRGEVIQIVSGCARGADSLGERYAHERGYPVWKFPALWELYGKRAGYMRNEQMARFSTHLVAFWDGKSPGTQHMIECAVKFGLQYRVVRY